MFTKHITYPFFLSFSHFHAPSSRSQDFRIVDFCFVLAFGTGAPVVGWFWCDLRDLNSLLKHITWLLKYSCEIFVGFVLKRGILRSLKLAQRLIHLRINQLKKRGRNTHKICLKKLINFRFCTRKL